MKKRLFLFISGLLVLAFTACTANPTVTPDATITPTQTPIKKVTFKDYQQYEVENGVPKAKFDVTYYYGPNAHQFLENEDFLRLIAECGFTSIPVTVTRSVPESCTSYDMRIEVLNKMKEYGLTCSGLDIKYEAIKMKYEELSKSYFEDCIKIGAEAIKDCDNVCEWWIQDEPNSSLFGALGTIVEAIRENDPMRVGFINLFPTIAQPSQWGTETYEEYIQKYIDEVSPFYLCFDNYPFMNEDTGFDSFFTNFEIIRKKALENNLSYQNIVLSTDWIGWTKMTKEKIAWQVSNSLVYGTKRISYFTFWLEQYYIDEGDTNACVDYKGNVYPRYYDVQEINRWLLPIGTEIFNKTSTAVFHVLGSFDLDDGCTEYTSYGKLGKVLSLEGDFAIGFFDDDSFIISNKNYTSATETNKLYLVDLSLDTKLEYFDTDTATWQPASNCSRISVPESENEKYSVTLNHGSCIYLRVAD